MPTVIRRRGITAYIDTSRLFSAGHTVWRWHERIGEQAAAAARLEAPVRSGALKASIYSTRPTHSLGAYSQLLEVIVGARRRYSIFVHEGTHGPIRSASGKRMGPMSMPNGVAGYAQPRDPVASRGFGGTAVGKRFTGATDFIGFPKYAYVVSGQDPNPFLARALDTVGHRHRWRAGRVRLGGLG